MGLVIDKNAVDRVRRILCDIPTSEEPLEAFNALLSEHDKHEKQIKQEVKAEIDIKKMVVKNLEEQVYELKQENEKLTNHNNFLLCRETENYFGEQREQDRLDRYMCAAVSGILSKGLHVCPDHECMHDLSKLVTSAAKACMQAADEVMV